MERPAVTVVVPGTVPRAEPQVDGPVRARPVLPGRWVGLAAAVVLSAGVLRAATDDRPPALPAQLPPPVPGVAATALDPGLGGEPLLERFGLFVRIAPPRPRGDSASPSQDDEVALLAVTAPGFFVRLDGVTLPVEFGPPSRTGAARAFDVSAQVSDCGVDTQAQRTLQLQVRRGTRTGPVKVAVDGAVVRLLDRLVARTCRRPRG